MLDATIAWTQNAARKRGAAHADAIARFAARHAAPDNDEDNNEDNDEDGGQDDAQADADDGAEDGTDEAAEDNTGHVPGDVDNDIASGITEGVAEGPASSNNAALLADDPKEAVADAGDPTGDPTQRVVLKLNGPKAEHAPTNLRRSERKREARVTFSDEQANQPLKKAAETGGQGQAKAPANKGKLN